MDEIASFVYEEKDKLSDEAQAIFDKEMNESVIHVEYEKAEGSFLMCSPGSFRNEENKHRYIGAC